MLLAKIRTDVERFQFRDRPFSERTVNNIVKEGIDLARFDPIPVVMVNGHATVGGDGHSRYEAIRRLAHENRLPKEWKIHGGWNVPTREIEACDAARLAHVANMSRDPYTPTEEARIFQLRLDADETIDDIATSSHRSSGYVKDRLRLNLLCKTVREAVGKSWGIDVDKAIVFARACETYEIDHQTQQQLWLKILKNCEWTQRSLQLFMKKIGNRLHRGKEDDFLFELSASVETAVQEITSIANDRRRARRALSALIQSVESLADVDVDLYDIIKLNGPDILAKIKLAEEEDAEALGELI